MPFGIMLLSGAALYYLLPFWWSIVPASFLTAFILCKNGRTAFWAGFCSNALIWCIMIFIKTIPNDNLLAARMAGLFHLPHLTLLLCISVLIGGLFSGFTSLSGYWVRQAVKVYFNKNTPL